MMLVSLKNRQNLSLKKIFKILPFNLLDKIINIMTAEELNKSRQFHLQSLLQFVAAKKQQIIRKQKRSIPPAQKNLRFLTHNNYLQTQMPQNAIKALREEHLARGSLLADLQYQSHQLKMPFLSLDSLHINHYQRIKSISVKKQSYSYNKSLPKYSVIDKKNIKKRRLKSQKNMHSIVRQLPIQFQEKQQYKKIKRTSFLQSLVNLRKGKTNQRLDRLLNHLQKENPLFANLHRIVGVCLLRGGQIIHKFPNQLLYSQQSKPNVFYIILRGEVKLQASKQLRKISQGGESLLQELLMGSKYALQSAITESECWFLQIQLLQYHRMLGELMRHGFKQAVRSLQSMIKRNYITKKWVRKHYLNTSLKHY